MMSVMDRDTRSVITIDGPAASGKSSVAQSVATRLDIPFVSSGLLYRAAAYLVLRHGVDSTDETAVRALLERHDVRLVPRVDGNRVQIDGEDVSRHLHTDDVDASVSTVASHASVRSWVFDELRELSGPFVVEGRDMGTSVFPEARNKFYLTASPEERARRRVGERRGDLSEVAASIRRRDQLDAKQLAPAPDAMHIDTDELALDEVVSAVLQGVRVGDSKSDSESGAP